MNCDVWVTQSSAPTYRRRYDLRPAHVLYDVGHTSPRKSRVGSASRHVTASGNVSRLKSHIRLTPWLPALAYKAPTVPSAIRSSTVYLRRLPIYAPIFLHISRHVCPSRPLFTTTLVNAKMLNEQSRIAYKGWSLSLVLGSRPTTPYR